MKWAKIKTSSASTKTAKTPVNMKIKPIEQIDVEQIKTKVRQTLPKILGGRFNERYKSDHSPLYRNIGSKSATQKKCYLKE